ncbi:MAG: extensin family protein, partial [Pseudomonadota bacterium]
VREGLVPAARRHLGGQPSEIFVAASYACRTRRTGRGPSRRLSEHAKANAIDVRGVKLADGRSISIAPKGSGRSKKVEDFQAAIRAAGCEAFKTVIGPLTDPAHSNHLHFDLAQRRRGGVVCR